MNNTQSIKASEIAEGILFGKVAQDGTFLYGVTPVEVVKPKEDLRGFALMDVVAPGSSLKEGHKLKGFHNKQRIARWLNKAGYKNLARMDIKLP